MKRVSTKARDLALEAYEAIRQNQKTHDGSAQIERATWSTEAPDLVRLRLDDGVVITVRPISVTGLEDRAQELAARNLETLIVNGGLRSVLSKGRLRLFKRDIDAVIDRASRGKRLVDLEVAKSARLRRCLAAAKWPEPLINFLIYRSVN